jgi:hypothetical protein
VQTVEPRHQVVPNSFHDFNRLQINVSPHNAVTELFVNLWKIYQMEDFSKIRQKFGFGKNNTEEVLLL